MGTYLVLAVMLLGQSCTSDEQREKELHAAATEAATAAYAKGKAEAEQAAAKAQQEVALRAVEEATQRAAQHAAEAEQAARDAVQQEKKSLRRSPTKFLVVSDPRIYDKGLFNSYRQLTQMTVLNRSKYAVTNISGEIDWLTADDAKIGSTTYSLTGSLPAGDTKTFTTSNGSLTSATLQGNAAKQLVRFTHVDIVE